MRLPPVATAVVTLAVATMIGLGVWQLRRADEKAALLARYHVNQRLPEMAFPRLAPLPPAALFRRASLMCLRVVAWRVEGGAAANGGGGYRHIADCATGAEGPGALVDVGVSSDPGWRPDWRGGLVEGVVTTEPDHRSLLARAFRPTVRRPMLVALRPAPGLRPSRQPNPADVPNNHLAYAVQWFVFAGVALVIYALALRRSRGAASATGAESSGPRDGEGRN